MRIKLNKKYSNMHISDKFIWLDDDLCIRLSWKSHERLLKKSWKTFEKVLKDFWKSHERLLKKSWKTFEKVMKDFWKSHERLLKKSWKTFEKVMKDFWKSHERLLKKSWTIALQNITALILELTQSNVSVRRPALATWASHLQVELQQVTFVSPLPLLQLTLQRILELLGCSEPLPEVAADVLQLRHLRVGQLQLTSQLANLR